MTLAVLSALAEPTLRVCALPYAEASMCSRVLATCDDVVQALIDQEANGMAAKGIKAAKPRPLPIPFLSLAGLPRILATVDAVMAHCDQLKISFTTAAMTRRVLLDASLAEALSPVDVASTETAE